MKILSESHIAVPCESSENVGNEIDDEQILVLHFFPALLLYLTLLVSLFILVLTALGFFFFNGFGRVL